MSGVTTETILHSEHGMAWHGMAWHGCFGVVVHDNVMHALFSTHYKLVTTISCEFLKVFIVFKHIDGINDIAQWLTLIHSSL